jgi:hypothetical protein
MGKKPELAPIAAAITALIARHEALRSKLAVENDIPILLPVRSEPELACIPVPRAEVLAQREGRPAPALASFFTAPIDLFEQPGFRAQAFMHEEGEVSLGILMHHYYGDAWSSQIVRREFTALHAASLGQQTASLPPAAQYSEYGLFQRRALEKSLSRHLTYWHRTLRDAPAARLPYDSPGDSATGMLGRAYFLVAEGVMRRIDDLAKAQRVSLGLVCYAAFQIALARWCGQAGMVSGLIAANRIRPQFLGTVGSLLSIIPVASQISSVPFRSFLMGFAKTVFDGVAQQDISVDNYNEIFLPPEPFGVPRFNFVPRQENFFVGAGDQTPAVSGVQQFPDIRRNSAYTDLHFLMLEYPNGLLGRVVFAKTLSFATIKAMVDVYQVFLKRIAADPDTALDALS